MRLWDWFCLASIVGIWPRWIEPNLLVQREYSRPFRTPHPIKVAHLSDLHFSRWSCPSHLDRIARAVAKMEPDLILFTGDFLSFSQLEDPDGLLGFLRRFSAPHGCFASLGNHDYARYALCSPDGTLDLDLPRKGAVAQAIELLLHSPAKCEITVSARVKETPIHPELETLLADSPFRLLHNETLQHPLGINITGLGDLWMGRCLPKRAFESYDPDLEGILLSHNPESIDHLGGFPGKLLLSGHTHGAQINLPWIGPRLAALKDPKLKRGWARRGGKELYISAGIGAAEPFRLFSPPEIALITLEPAS